MAYTDTHEKALVLRKRGASITEIARDLHMHKSTVSYWCRDIVLSPRHMQALAKRQERGGLKGRLKAAEKKRAARLVATAAAADLGKKDIGRLSERDLFILGMGLYWGEGYKKGNEECGFTNSSPAIIKMYIAWLESAYDITRADLIARVSINQSHTDVVTTIQKAWSKVSGIPLSQFTKPSIIHAKTTKLFSNRGSYLGTLRIKVRRSTSLHRRIMGSLNEITRIAYSIKSNSRNTRS